MAQLFFNCLKDHYIILQLKPSYIKAKLQQNLFIIDDVPFQINYISPTCHSFFIQPHIIAFLFPADYYITLYSSMTTIKQSEPFDQPYKQHLLHQETARLIHENNEIRMQVWSCKEENEKMKIKLLTKMGHKYEDAEKESQSCQLMKVKLLNREQQIIRLQKLVEENYNYIYYREITKQYDAIIQIMQQEIHFLNNHHPHHPHHPHNPKQHHIANHHKQRHSPNQQPNQLLNSDPNIRLKLVSSLKQINKNINNRVSVNSNTENIIYNMNKEEKPQIKGSNTKDNNKDQKAEDFLLKIHQLEKVINNLNKKIQKKQLRLSQLLQQNTELKAKNKSLKQKMIGKEKEEKEVKEERQVGSMDRSQVQSLRKQIKRWKREVNAGVIENKALSKKLLQMQEVIVRLKREMIVFEKHVTSKMKEAQFEKIGEDLSLKSSIMVG